MCITHRIKLLRFLLWLAVILSCIIFSLGKSCNTLVLFDCDKNEVCKENATRPGFGACECRFEFVREGGKCVHSLTPNPSAPLSSTVRPVDDQQSNNRGDFPVALWLIVPCVIVAIVTGLVVIGRRYMWMERLYQLRVRHYDTVLINSQGDNDDDDDDPPIV